MNPEDFVLKTNIQLMQSGRNFDADYNFNELRQDALPRLIEVLPTLNDRQRCDAENRLTNNQYRSEDYGRLINWNYSRWSGQAALENYKAKMGVTSLQWKKCHELYPESNTR